MLPQAMQQEGLLFQLIHIFRIIGIVRVIGVIDLASTELGVAFMVISAYVIAYKYIIPKD